MKNFRINLHNNFKKINFYIKLKTYKYLVKTQNLTVFIKLNIIINSFLSKVRYYHNSFIYLNYIL